MKYYDPNVEVVSNYVCYRQPWIKLGDHIVRADDYPITRYATAIINKVSLREYESARRTLAFANEVSQFYMSIMNDVFSSRSLQQVS